MSTKNKLIPADFVQAMTRFLQQDRWEARYQELQSILPTEESRLTTLQEQIINEEKIVERLEEKKHLLLQDIMNLQNERDDIRQSLFAIAKGVNDGTNV